MQFTTTFITFIACTVGVMAAPNGPPKPGPPAPPPKPVAPAPPTVSNHQVNYCSSGSPYCCAPTDASNYSLGTTCSFSTTTCNAISVCCNNAAIGQATAQQTCVGGLIGPVIFASVNAA